MYTSDEKRKKKGKKNSRWINKSDRKILLFLHKFASNARTSDNVSKRTASKKPEHARVGKFSYISDVVPGKKLNSRLRALRNGERS